MSGVTIIWSAIASACLTLAIFYGLVWYRNRTAWAHLLFSFTAASTTAFAFCELWLMRVETPEQLLVAMRWSHVPVFVWLVAIVCFVRTYLGAGRLWLAGAALGLRAVSLLLNFVTAQNLNQREITTLRHIRVLGERVTVFVGVPNPWMLVGQAAVVLVLIFVAEASVTAWRRGDRRKALMVGGSVELFLLAALSLAVVVLWAHVQVPIVFSPFFLGVVAVMAYELSKDVLRASQLVRELQASEAGLRESEARLSLAVDAADFGMWIRDLARDEIWASRKWRALFGFAPSEHLAFDGVLQRLHPDDRGALRQAHAAAVAGADGGRYQTEYRLVLPDGATRWISSTGRVERDAGGRPVVIRGASRDVTASKQADQETQLLRQEIAHAGRVSVMGQLASALAHEINQPLAAINWNAGAAERMLRKGPPDFGEVRSILADIREDGVRARAIIDRMRELLKPHRVETRPLDVGALVGEVAALVRVDAATRQVTLNVDVPRDLPYVRGDRVHLQQVLLNLILNGMDALHGASLQDRRVSVTSRLGAAQIVEIAVDDSGPGIAAGALEQIFDPFFTTKPDGMGMGLAISRTIVEAHGGELWAENQQDGGAAFRFTLRIAQEADPD